MAIRISIPDPAMPFLCEFQTVRLNIPGTWTFHWGGFFDEPS